MESYKSLTLHGRSFSEWGGNSIAVSFPYKRCEYVDYA